MIDRDHRDLYAEHLRHFAAGIMSVEEYEALTKEFAFATKDRACKIYWTVWTLYDDFRTERLRGEWKLTGQRRKAVACCVLFLYSDKEYEWPEEGNSLLNLLTLGWWGRRLEKVWWQKLGRSGEWDCWPFLCCEDLEAAKRTPKFFARG